MQVLRFCNGGKVTSERYFVNLRMLQSIYHDVILAGWVTCLVLGVCLLAGRLPKRPVFATYARSRNILGIAYIIFGLAIAQFTLFNLRVTAPAIAVSLQLTYYYLEGILFGMSFSSLLDKNYICRRQLTVDFGLYAGFLVVNWGAVAADVCMGGPTGALWGTVLHIIAAAWFFIAASAISWRFFRIYRTTMRKLNNYYADNAIDSFVRWLNKSVYGIVFCGLSGALLAFAPMQFNCVFMSVGIVMFIYIFSSFQNYILNYESVERTTEDDETVPAPEESANDLAMAVERWVAGKNYLQTGLTMADLAQAVGTNRTYISAFINSHYNCSFRDWINSLRMKYAKNLLLSQKQMTVEKIALASGFTSASYFCKQFAQREGCTPSDYRQRNTSL